MLDVWTKNLAEQDKEDFAKRLLSFHNTAIYNRLLEILDLNKKSAQTTVLSKQNYESPSWAYIQADSIGYQRALTEIESLLKGIVR